MTEEFERPEESSTFTRYHHHRSSGGAFGAVLLIFLGVIFLLNNFGVLPWSAWEILWRFWPILLIIGGLQVVLGRFLLGKIVVALVSSFIFFVIIVGTLGAANSRFGQWLESRFPWWPEIRLEQITPRTNLYRGAGGRV